MMSPLYFLSPWLAASAALAIIVAGAVSTWTYNLLFHPLHHIPGPWYSAISPIWMRFHEIRLSKTLAIYALFKIYGPVVRIEPNVVAFLDQKAIHAVYGGSSPFPKSDFYSALKVNGRIASVSIP